MFEANQFRKQTSKLPLAGAATNIIFVATKVLSHQTHFCRNKTRNKQIHTCRDKSFVVTSLLLLRQTRVCRDKTRDDVVCRDKSLLAATKNLLLAAPANDSKQTNKSISGVVGQGQRRRRSRPTDSLGCQSDRVQDGLGTDHACSGHLRRPQHHHRRLEAPTAVG